jgi:hypothetical protein
MQNIVAFEQIFYYLIFMCQTFVNARDETSLTCCVWLHCLHSCTVGSPHDHQIRSNLFGYRAKQKLRTDVSWEAFSGV